MKLEGIHHITAITGDAQANVDFYAGTLGLRMVKKTVNQDAPSVYHLFYADEQGDPGSDITFFEFRGAPVGRAGAGMVHRIVWRVGSPEALDFWAERLGCRRESERDGDRLRFADPEGLEHELVVADGPRPAADRRPSRGPGRARAAGLSRRPRLLAPIPSAAPACSSSLEFERTGDGWEARGDARGGALGLRRAARRARASRAPARFTTSPGPRRWTSTSTGASARSPAARARPR